MFIIEHRSPSVSVENVIQVLHEPIRPTDFEWRVIKPLFPNKSRGVRHVDDRRVLNGMRTTAIPAGLGVCVAPSPVRAMGVRARFLKG
jgi:hypothetical protein